MRGEVANRGAVWGEVANRGTVWGGRWLTEGQYEGGGG